MFLSAYQYEIEYKNSKAHANSDCLSRLPMDEDKELKDPVTVFQVSHVDQLPVTARDIASVYSHVMEGWPNKALNHFTNIRINCLQIKGVCCGGGE